MAKATVEFAPLTARLESRALSKQNRLSNGTVLVTKSALQVTKSAFQQNRPSNRATFQTEPQSSFPPNSEGRVSEGNLAARSGWFWRARVQGAPRLRSGQALHGAARFRAASLRMTTFGDDGGADVATFERCGWVGMLRLRNEDRFALLVAVLGVTHRCCALMTDRIGGPCVCSSALTLLALPR